VSTERWERVQQLVEAALALPESERSAHVESTAPHDVALRDEVLSLLAAPAVDTIPTPWLAAIVADTPSRFAAGGRVADRYRIERLLGEGGMGEVYEAFDEELSITVALKTLRLTGRTEAALPRLKLEGLLARAIWHPGVCRVFDVAVHDDADGATCFLAMELLHGPTLAERLRESGRLPPDVVRQLAEPIAAGLAAAHEAGVAHLDLKPANIMLVSDSEGERPVVTDFGMARFATPAESSESDSGSGAVAGTPAYMAPEQVRGETAGPAADIYAFGILLLEMLTGAPPFLGKSSLDTALKRLIEAPPLPSSRVPGLDPIWDAVIGRCLALEPERRFARATDVIEALQGRSPTAEMAMPDATRHLRDSLPQELDLFVGREAELESLDTAMAAGVRLVTLVGPGGMGKTRLAVHYARRHRESWPGGVWLANLAEAHDANGIASAVAGSLGIPLGRGDAIAQLGYALAGAGRCLLVLDGFERVAACAADTLGRWPDMAPGLRCVVTTRERLNLEAEVVLPVESLEVEAGVELFLARAEALRPGIEFAGNDRTAVRSIVELIDAMPLAIELAAARIRVMSVVEILDRMQRRFQLLAGGRSAHHETLETTIEGSWELLTPSERNAWAQASVFEGGFTLESAEAVLVIDSGSIGSGLIDVLRSLVDKSLVRVVVPAGESGPANPRFLLYASLQEFARARLSAAQARAVADRHGEWYARLGAADGIEALEGPGGVERWHRIERELDNLTAACRRAARDGGARTTADCFRATWAVLKLRGPFAALVELGHAVLLHLPAGIEAAHVRLAMGEAGLFAGAHDAARVQLEAALSVAREASDPRLTGRILFILGRVDHDQARLAEALEHFEASVIALREANDRRFEGCVINAIGMTHHLAGRIDDSRHHHEAALVIARELGDRRTEGVTLSNLGIFYQNIGRPEEARRHFEAALAIHRALANRRSEGITRLNLGSLATDVGNATEARPHLEEALAIARAIGARRSEGVAFAALGELLVDQGEWSEARDFLESALVIHREVHDRVSEGIVLGALGRFHHHMGDVGAARAHYEAALELHRAVGDRRYEGAVLTNLALLLAAQGSVEAAREALRRAEHLLREIDARVDVGKLLCVRADVERQTGNPAAAEAALEEARAIAEAVGAGPDSELARLLAARSPHSR